MTFDVGDTVALSGPLIMQLAQEHPPVFEYLRDAGRHGGQITDVNGNSISVDIGMDRPLIIDIDPSEPQQLLQIVRKACEPAAAMPLPEEAQSAAQDAPASIMGEGVPQMPMSMPLPLQQMLQQMNGRLVPIVVPVEPPRYVRVAQWVIQHFADMKKFVITQDINEGQRRQAARSQRLPGDIGEVYDSERVPVRAELSAAETRLYEDSLEAMGDWLHTLRNESKESQNTAQSQAKTTSD